LDAADTIVNDALARAPRDADRFCAKHSLGTTPPASSHFFGARLDGPDQVRAFFDMLRSLSAGA
jgi:hypothetical protein